ncbi:hypothetical protein JTB14_032665 [Gonioctena quinquepunctata]|nr:hypothetical protein JTB14_032665 [Gonioctena quinquepunctata]
MEPTLNSRPWRKARRAQRRTGPTADITSRNTVTNTHILPTIKSVNISTNPLRVHFFAASATPTPESASPSLSTRRRGEATARRMRTGHLAAAPYPAETSTDRGKQVLIAGFLSIFRPVQNEIVVPGLTWLPKLTRYWCAQQASLKDPKFHELKHPELFGLTTLCSVRRIICDSDTDSAISSVAKDEEYSGVQQNSNLLGKLDYRPNSKTKKRIYLKLFQECEDDLSKKYPELKNHYTELNKQYSLELSKAKRSHIDNKINSSTNKTKATWNIISEIQGKKKAANLKIIENDEQLDDEVVANNFLRHFSLATDKGGNDVEFLTSNI